MKRKKLKNALAIFLAGCILLPLWPSAIEEIPADEASIVKSEKQTSKLKEPRTADPFALMYDSDELFLKQVEPLLEQELRQPVEETDPDSIAAQTFNTSLQTKIAMQSASFTALEAVSLESPSLLENIGIDEHLYQLAESIYDGSRTDRFIVKYKEPETDATFSSYFAQQMQSGSLDFITLDEKVNPAEFARDLQEAGLTAHLEYIQPDFLLSYAGLDLSMEILEEEEEETENTENPEPDIPAEEPTDMPEPIEEESAEILEEEILEPASEPQEVIVALIDSGVDVSHPGLSGVLLDGWNFVDDNDVLYEKNHPMSSAHGTHLAGILANESGELVKILPLKVFGERGAYTSDIIAAIGYAEAAGARVANCSFGSGSYNPALEEMMANSYMLFVAAVGNAREDLAESPVYPAAFDLENIITVASVNQDNGFSYYSNYSNSMIDIAATGRDIESTLPDGKYGLQSGTSMAAAMVSAASGWVLSENSDLTAADLKQRMIESADMAEHLQNKVTDGRLLNVVFALEGYLPDEVISLPYEDDFDVHGYQPTPEESWELFSTSPIMQVASGNTHTLFLLQNGTVWAAGDNTYGQLGIGTFEGSTLIQDVGLTRVLGVDQIVYIDAAFTQSIAVRADGTVWEWGKISGSVPEKYSAIPINTCGLTNVKEAKAGLSHSGALTYDRELWLWGYSSPLITNPSYLYKSDAPVKAMDNVLQFFLSNELTFTVEEEQEYGIQYFYGWGNNRYYQLGTGERDYFEGRPLDVYDTKRMAISNRGYSHSDITILAIAYGGVYQWPTVPRKINEAISGDDPIIEVAAGHERSVFLTEAGYVYEWTRDDWDFEDLREIRTLSDVSQLESLTNSFFALHTDGSVSAWGDNTYGQLGIGSEGYVDMPQKITYPTYQPDPHASSLEFEKSSYQFTIPEEGIETHAVTAILRDQYQSEINDHRLDKIRYSSVDYPGVSIDSAGTLSISPEARPGEFSVYASYDASYETQYNEWSYNASAKVSLRRSLNGITGEIAAVEHEKYQVKLSASDIVSATELILQIQYDPAMLELVDCAAQTNNMDIQVGLVPQTPITILSHENGELVIRFDPEIPGGKLWSGTITIFKFKALHSGATTLTVSG